jgi:hypothetical protein
MNTPTPDRDEAAEGPVHDLLWRLRARLVTPPTEQQVDADLDRLLSAAREHAHIAPAAAEVEFARPAAITAEDLPPVAHLRGYRVLDRVGKVAAVFVLVVGVGGAVVMRPGLDGSTGIPAILGQGDGDENGLFAANADEIANGQAGLDIDDVESTLSNESVNDAGSDASPPSGGSGVPAPSDAAVTSEGSTDADTPSGSTGGSGATDGGSGSTSAPKPSPSETAPKPSPSPTSEPSEDPDGFDGFGGGRLCPAPSDPEDDAADGEDDKATDAKKKPDDGEQVTPNPCVPPEPSEDGDSGDSSVEEEDEVASEGEGSSSKLERPKLPGDPPERAPRD